MNEALIVTGGNINKYFLETYIKNHSFQYIIAVDKGIEALDRLGILPTHLIGDFDSVNKEIIRKYDDKNIIISILNKEKDYTDTDMGLQLAINLKTQGIIIIGGIGTRMDHTLANIHIMKRALEKNINCKMVDEHNEIYLINNKEEFIIDNNYEYVSLIPLTDIVEGVCLKGFKYLLDNKILKIGNSIGISNKQIEKNAIIKISKGILIVIKSRD